MKLNTEVNSWLVILVVLLTAGITSWVMLRDKSGKNGTIVYYPPQQVAQNFSPGIMALNSAGILVGSIINAPVILAGAVPLHADFGPCTSCHPITTTNKEVIPKISASSIVSHENRGLCINCHRLIKRPSIVNANMVQPPIVQIAAARQIPMAPRPLPMTTAAKKAAEGEWMGMEVAPITPLTATQFGVPRGTRGLVVAEAEGTAFNSGLKAGDVILSVNGTPVFNMNDFIRGTRNGTLKQGIVEVLRKNQKLAVNITSNANLAAAAPNNPHPNLLVREGIPAAVPRARF